MSALCTLLGYSRQAYYQHHTNNYNAFFAQELLIQEVNKHRLLLPRIGTRKLMVMLEDFVNKQNIKLGRDALFTLLREQNLLVRHRRRKVQTTLSRHRLKKYPNLIMDFTPLAANALWVSDITYIHVGNNFAYLNLVTDAYSRKIVGFCLWKSLAATGSINALTMALQGYHTGQGLIHHSDRGVQYCSNKYVQMLSDKKVQISMTQSGDPLENAIAERVNGILKEELLQVRYDDFASAQKRVAKAVTIYNTLRPHMSCEMRTPEVAHQHSGQMQRKWKNYYKKTEAVEAGFE